ncbi:hypothetical protein [Vulcanisaeta sp. JCM 16159]|uniref:hypothetical protein n=1 Tax=Vulcanisaeta sp. JCM 16159 TaxID=1295371 RepID=UPI000AA34840|nr:hypothetical protein [Vulcanisaeta sp. JCM 16159]
MKRCFSYLRTAPGKYAALSNGLFDLLHNSRGAVHITPGRLYKYAIKYGLKKQPTGIPTILILGFLTMLEKQGLVTRFELARNRFAKVYVVPRDGKLMAMAKTLSREEFIRELNELLGDDDGE